jgi:hypothetical protein
LLSKIALPLVRPSFPTADAKGLVPIDVIEASAIVLSQSCDLEQRRIPNVILAQIFSVDEFEKTNPSYKDNAGGRWGLVAKGRIESLHLLRSPGNADDPRASLVVDFRVIASLPLEYVETVASTAGDRWRLLSPYIEDLSQNFGRFFMRVALPTNPIAF